MRRKILICTTFLLLASGFCELEAADWKQLIDLRGQWAFTVGDDPAWSQPSANTSDWDMLPVPYNWEHFYEGYNGYAWYRKTFDLLSMPNEQELILFLGYIDDVDEVFLNGIHIGQTGKFPPRFSTAYNVERQYRIPENILKTGTNTIAIRVYDEMRDGGIVTGSKVGIYTDKNQVFLEVNLSGDWKFSTENEINFQKTNFDDQEWKTVHVPATWESQGYEGYDGYGFYRKQFNLPSAYIQNENYLVLGKIDDFDHVFLNGQQIGKVEDLEDYSSYNRDNSYRIYRVYKIPSGLLKSENVIAVEVLDHYGVGGIYEGPIGLMSRDRMLRFLDNIDDERFDDNPLEILFKLLFK